MEKILLNQHGEAGYPNLEERGKYYQEKLKEIINTKLIVENSAHFLNTLFEKLVTLVEDYRLEYTSHFPVVDKTDREIEDLAAEEYGIHSVSKLFDILESKRESMKIVDKVIVKNMQTAKSQIIPAQKIEMPLGKGEGTFDEPEFPRRLETILYILKEDLGIDIENNVTLTEGEVPSEGFREVSYTEVKIPELDRLVYVCNQKGNITFVFDLNVLHQYGIDHTTFRNKNKEELKEIIDKYPQAGASIIHSKYWRDYVVQALTQMIPKNPEKPQSTEKEIIPKVCTLKYLPSPNELGEKVENPEYGFVKVGERRYSTKHQLHRVFDVDDSKIISWINLYNIRSIKMVDVKNEKRDGYAVEDFLEIPEIQRYLSVPKVDSRKTINGVDNPDYGFIKIGNLNFGSMLSISKKIGVTNIFIDHKTKGLKLETRNIRDLQNKEIKAFSIEEILMIPEIRERVEMLKNTPEVVDDEKDYWYGFYENNGLHYGSKQKMSKKIERDRDFIARLVRDYNIRKLEVLDPSKVKGWGYCYEDIVEALKKEKEEEKIN